MGIGENIRFLRERHNLTQSDLADRLSISDKTVSSWEIGRTEPKMGMVEKICLVLDCKKTDIIGGDANEDGYYVNPETAAMAQELFENSDMRMLFDAARDASPEDLKATYDVLMALKRKERDFVD